MNGPRSDMITWSIFALVVFSVGCSALAQIALKHGMAQTSVQVALGSDALLPIAVAIISNPFVVGGLMLYGGSAVVWLFVLARLDVSVAYPFVALGFLITMALGCFLLGEDLTVRKVLGTLVVMLGVYLVAAAR